MTEWLLRTGTSLLIVSGILAGAILLGTVAAAVVDHRRGKSGRKAALQFLRAVKEALRDIGWVMVHPKLMVQYARVAVLAPDAPGLFRLGWTPEVLKCLRDTTDGLTRMSDPFEQSMAAGGVALLFERYRLTLAPLLPPAALLAWLPNLHYVALDRRILDEAYLPRVADEPDRVRIVRVGRYLADWHAAAGDLLTLCLDAGLTRAEVIAARKREDFTEESLRVLVALRADDATPDQMT